MIIFVIYVVTVLAAAAGILGHAPSAQLAALTLAASACYVLTAYPGYAASLAIGAIGLQLWGQHLAHRARREQAIAERLARLHRDEPPGPPLLAPCCEFWLHSDGRCICGTTERLYWRGAGSHLPYCTGCEACECGQQPCVRTGINDPEVSETAALRQRADQLTATLREVLAMLTPAKNEHGTVVGYEPPHPIVPPAVNRPRAVLDQIQEQQ